jgi:Rrf2 family transcriptional regulator, iron-sulfur cluster assembly transcription factor
MGCIDMMGLTRKTDYAIRGMLYLASLPEEKVVLIGEIAKAVEAPQPFLAKIFQRFSKAGLVRSSRGAGGGFVLARSPEQVTLREIIEAVEGTIISNRCVMGQGSCSRMEFCPVHPVWLRIQATTRGILEEVTLKTLVPKR